MQSHSNDPTRRTALSGAQILFVAFSLCGVLAVLLNLILPSAERQQVRAEG